jgi:hypothetical protein
MKAQEGKRKLRPKVTGLAGCRSKGETFEALKYSRFGKKYNDEEEERHFPLG